MPHGTPDWGHTGPKETTFGLDDLGELAARLGSLVTFDRRGDVLWLDDFEDGLAKVNIAVSGGGAYGALETAKSRSGAFDLRLVGGSSDAWTAQAVYILGYPALSSFGFEVSVAFVGELDYLQVRILLDTGTVRVGASIRYERGATRWTRLDHLGAYVPFIPAWTFIPIYRPYHTIKLVMDPTVVDPAVGHTGAWKRVLIDNGVYLTGGELTNPGATLGVPGMRADVTLVSRNLFNDFVRVDDVIITQNEP